MIAHDRKLDTFSRCPLFKGLTGRELADLASIAVEKRFGPGETLFFEGQPCTGLFVIGTGSVKIVKTAPSGRQVMLAVEREPSTVAEVPLFDGGDYPASVVTLEEVTAYHLPTDEFRRLCRRQPDVMLKVVAVVGRRLRQMVQLVEGVTFGSVRQRLAAVLLEFGAAGDGPFALPATHEELALRLGTVREVVSRNLSRFQAEGFIQVHRREIRILDRAALQAEAETAL
jgi:CRP-like cAMP-binding protein